MLSPLGDYTLKTSGLKYPGHLKMTQFGSNVLLLTHLVVTFGSILEENVWPGIPGQRKKQDGGAWKERETDQGVFLANYSQYVS